MIAYVPNVKYLSGTLDNGSTYADLAIKNQPAVNAPYIATKKIWPTKSGK